MKILDGQELAEFIKERQAGAVHNLKQAWGVQPKLVIIIAKDDPVINKYVSLKRRYGEDIGVAVEVYNTSQELVPELIDQIKKDSSVHGAILQLPLANPAETSRLCDLLPADKDVDGLGTASVFDAATPTAINWLLAAYAVDLKAKQIVIVGEGRLVGAPLAKMWRSSGLEVTVVTEETANPHEIISIAEVLVTAVGKADLIKSDDIAQGAVVVDAGVSSEKGVLKGDLADDVRGRQDLTITPVRGGVGPLTVCALFENVLTSARKNKGDLPHEV